MHDMMWSVFICRLSESKNECICQIGDKSYSVQKTFWIGLDTPIGAVKIVHKTPNETATVALSKSKDETVEIEIGEERIRIEQHQYVLPTEEKWKYIFQSLNELDAACVNKKKELSD